MKLGKDKRKPLYRSEWDQSKSQCKNLTREQLKAFLTKIQKDAAILSEVRKASTANEIAEIAASFGYQFTGDELKAISKETIPGIKIKKQDTSPSYSFGESGNWI